MELSGWYICGKVLPLSNSNFKLQGKNNSNACYMSYLYICGVLNALQGLFFYSYLMGILTVRDGEFRICRKDYSSNGGTKGSTAEGQVGSITYPGS